MEEDCSAFAVVGDAVSPPPPLRFNVAFAIEGVDDPAEGGAVAHLTAVAYLSPCHAKMPGKTSMVLFAGSLRVGSELKMVSCDDMVSVYSECVDGPALIPSAMNGP